MKTELFSPLGGVRTEYASPMISLNEIEFEGVLCASDYTVRHDGFIKGDEYEI